MKNIPAFLPTPKTLEVSLFLFRSCVSGKKNPCSGRKSINTRPLLYFFSSSPFVYCVGVVFPDLLHFACNSHHANLCWLLHCLVWCRGSCFPCVATTSGCLMLVGPREASICIFFWTCPLPFHDGDVDRFGVYAFVMVQGHARSRGCK